MFLAAVVATLILGRVGVLQQLETAALDFQMRLRAPAAPSQVAIVRISDDDYRNLFESRSPLDAGRLQKLLEAIALGKPKAIGIDIDTSASQFQDLPVSLGTPPIVWARNGIFSNRDGRFHLQNVLGGKQPAPPSGLAVLREDADGVVRRYQRVYPTNDDNAFPSLPWAMVSKLGSQLSGTQQELFINYVRTGDGSGRVNLPASHVLELANSQGWQTDGPLKDKIVLLGGDYAVQDEHQTPVGWMLGVEVLANVIETELQGGGTRPASRAVIGLLQVFDGLALLLLFQLYRLRTAFLFSMLSVPVLAVLCSLAASGSLAQWSYFAPVLLAVLLQQLYERMKDYKKEMLLGSYNIVTDQPPQISADEPNRPTRTRLKQTN